MDFIAFVWALPLDAADALIPTLIAGRTPGEEEVRLEDLTVGDRR